MQYAAKNFTQGKALMQQAVEAGRRCRGLIQEYAQSNITTTL